MDKLINLLENTKYDAHRGKSWECPENSYNAIYLALFDDKVDAVEFDVRMTKDNKFILRHDDYLITTSKYFNKISNMTLEELETINVKFNKLEYYINRHQVMHDKDEAHSMRQLRLLNKLFTKTGKIITLDELLRMAPDNKKLLLEVKGSDDYYKTDKFSKGILEIINTYKNKNIWIHGFDAKTMLWFKNHTSNKVGIGVSKDISVLDLPLDHACLNLSRIKEQADTIISNLEKNPDREYHFWKVDTRKELELYKLFLNKMVEHGFNNPISIMSNDVKSSKILIKQDISRLKKSY